MGERAHERLREGWRTPHPRRLDPARPGFAAAMAAHDAACAAGLAAYRDPRSGFSVFTAEFLAERGWCCGSGCRHCPFVGADDAPR